MNTLNYTLLPDGPSDRALIPILSWLLREHLGDYAINPALADFRWLARRPRSLAERVQKAIELYPCDLLFVHRDAEAEPRAGRVREIYEAIATLNGHPYLPEWVCVIPVRMTEAWLLIEELAIRIAADNPNGRQRLDLPHIREIERVTDPKITLFALLREASGLTGRHLKRFDPERRRQRVAELINDFRPLRGLSAFQALESDVDAWAGRITHPVSAT